MVEEVEGRGRGREWQGREGKEGGAVEGNWERGENVSKGEGLRD